jgi:chromosome segregation protein
LNFSKGMTVIVGKNGCGKSNILDAVCFVLGRLSSKALRAENFASLLYNGGEGNPPAKFCRVTMVFNNQDRQLPLDVDEVSVSREIDTSGVSVYRLNGKRCTRTELLDTIGVAGLHPEGYNIVLQNELANIVGMSSTQIRQIVENIAGISVYDEKKRQIEEELKKVDANLSLVQVRTEEIHQEYERLERDRSDALRWQEITEKMGQLQRDLAFAEMARVEERLNDLKSEYTTLTKTVNQLEKQKRESKEQIITLESTAKSIEARMKDLESERHAKEVEKSRITEKISGLQTTLGKLRRQTESISASIIHLRSLEKTESDQYSQIEKLVMNLRSEAASLKEKITPLRTELMQLSIQISKPDTDYLESRTSVVSLTETIEQKRGTLGEVMAMYRVAEQNILNLQQQIRDSVSLVSDQERDIEEARTLLKEAEDEVQQERTAQIKIKEKQRVTSTSLLDHRREQTELNQLIQKTKDELLEARTRLKTIRELGKLRMSRQAAINAIMRYAEERQISGIYGTLASLGKTSTEYAVALEVASRGRLEYIVVDNEDTAARCIEYLKQSKIGRASFIPLATIKPQSSPYKGDHPGLVGNAIDLLSFDEKFRSAFEFAFGRTIIVQDLSVARAIEARGFRRITIDGDVVEPNHTLTGGYYKRLPSLSLEEESLIPELQRKLKELRELRESMDRDFEKLTSSNNQLDEQVAVSKRELTSLERRFGEARDDIADKEEALSTLKASITKLQESLQEEVSARDELLQKQQQEEEGIARLVAERQEYQERLAELERGSLDSTVNRLRGELDEYENQLRQVELQLTEKSSELRFVQAEQKRLQRDLLHSNNELERVKGELGYCEEENAAAQAQAETLEQEVVDLKNELVALEQQLEENESEQRRLAELVEELTTRINEERNSQSKLEVRIENWEERFSTQKEKVEGMEPPLLPILPSSVYSLRKQLTELEQEREELGLINQKAIERFDEVRQAYEEISVKEKNIRDEREAILEAMRKAEAEKFKVFMTSFTSISRHFAEVYEQLADGEGQLELENPENPFLGGIRMKARPAGKRVQYLDALSGGEKALTALAFIFALQLHQPAPFFFLDEIDESLDPTNTERVAKLLSKLSEDSQFIIISHNEITIRWANTLYGVAMVDGLSRVFSIKFEEGALMIEKSGARN